MPSRHAARYGRRVSRGFTLLELLIVVLLIGITLSFAVLRVGRNFDQVAEKEALRFVALLRHVRDESVLTGKMYGIEVDEAARTYQFVVENDGWKSLADDKLMRTRTIPEPLQLVVNEKASKGGKDKNESRFSKSVAKKTKTKAGKALIMVSPMGDISAFNLVIEGDDQHYRIGLDDNNEPVIQARDPDAV